MCIYIPIVTIVYVYCLHRGCSHILYVFIHKYTFHYTYLCKGLASSRDKKEDPIDRAVITHMDEKFGHDRAISRVAEYTRIRSVGFNPVYKRVLFEYTHPIYGQICVSKGIPNKVCKRVYIYSARILILYIHHMLTFTQAYINTLTLVYKSIHIHFTHIHIYTHCHMHVLI